MAFVALPFLCWGEFYGTCSGQVVLLRLKLEHTLEQGSLANFLRLLKLWFTKPGELLGVMPSGTVNELVQLCCTDLSADSGV